MALPFSLPPPLIQSASRSSNRFTFTWSTVAHQMYQIQYTTNLVRNVWANLGNPFMATDSTASISCTISNWQMFYRASLIPQ